MGTPFWTAPEIWNGQPCTTKADIFSLGVLLFEVATRRLPYDGIPYAEIIKGVASGELVPKFLEGVPKEIEDLSKSCFSKDLSKVSI